MFRTKFDSHFGIVPSNINVILEQSEYFDGNIPISKAMQVNLSTKLYLKANKKKSLSAILKGMATQILILKVSISSYRKGQPDDASAWSS